jgi:DNA polymerase III alpha subunit|tara:strand:+ start:2504 stop:3094 length:591 start_codon:yes stop_codon:yes gene_type:complete
MPDVDIDFFDRDGVLKLFKHTPATIIKEEKIEKHKTGVYFHAVPEHPVTGHSTIDYKEAEDRGYFKIDCLNVSIYKNIKSEQELVELMIQEPDWNMLKHQEIVDQLFHLNGHFNIVSTLQPKTIEQLAAVLAIIRPAKRYLLKQNWDEINTQVWKRPADNSYFFKKSHAVAYAHAIVVQMNLMSQDKYNFDEASKN